jgi:murein L,D-transpeptidase YcbB/YkuD
MNHPYVVLLRNRLQVIGYYSGAKSGQDSEFYNSELVLSVLDFQRRHGIEPDGVVGAETLAALNVPIEERIDQIRVNMERLRWVSQSLRNDYLLVDIAGFSVTLYQDGQLTWKTRAIVGRPYRRTPVFRASMTYMVLNPNWTVPRTILHEDILPKVKRDPAALIEKNLLVIDPLGQEVDPNKIDWDKFPASYRGYKLRQPPGPDNTLGRIKFMFPNPYVVYLHDTSSKLLFNETQRAFSSGCIRIENPLELAEILLESNTDYKREWLYEQIETQQTRTVQLNRALPVLMLYFTAEAHDGEFIQFRNDLYGRDDKVLKALTDKMSFTLGIVDSRSNHNISRKP